MLGGTPVQLYLSISFPINDSSRHIKIGGCQYLLLTLWLFIILGELLGTSFPVFHFSFGTDTLHSDKSAFSLLPTLPHLLRILLSLLSGYSADILKSFTVDTGKKNWRLKMAPLDVFMDGINQFCIFIDLKTQLSKAQL